MSRVHALRKKTYSGGRSALAYSVGDWGGRATRSCSVGEGNTAVKGVARVNNVTQLVLGVAGVGGKLLYFIRDFFRSVLRREKAE